MVLKDTLLLEPLSVHSHGKRDADMLKFRIVAREGHLVFLRYDGSDLTRGRCSIAGFGNGERWQGTKDSLGGYCLEKARKRPSPESLREGKIC